VRKCNLPGCDGTIGPDGYCDVCLERPAEAPRAQVAARTGGGVAAASATAGPGAVGFSRRASGDPWWGLDLVPLPEIPAVEPPAALEPKPSVPTSRRICAQCGSRIGRSHHGQPALSTGICHQCGKPYSFVPKLQRGTLVAERYLVSGCIGYGGLGWVFLAEDTNLKDQPVVLKGLIDAGSPHAAAAAERELRFLLEVDHPNIVRVRDVAAQPADDAHDDQYIVMEYIPGYTVDRLAGEVDVLTVELVIAYCLHLLAAVEHLHSRNWLHCDIKPPNLMLAGTGVKLIDLGAGCRKGATGHTWGTEGYRAPEVMLTGSPTVRSDLFAVGRTLEDMLPWAAGGAPDSPLRAQTTDSVDNFLARATAPDPADRFRTAAEMAGQLSGVLREIVALRDRRPHPAPSLLFGAERQCLGAELGRVPPLHWWTTDDAFRAAVDGRGRPLPDAVPAAREAAALLPTPRPNPADPAAALLLTLSGGDTSSADEQLAKAEQSSAEVNLLRCRTRLESGDLAGAEKNLAVARGLTEDGDWRIRWHDGLIKLAGGQFASARDDFDAVYRALPGEIVPKLALGLCQEHLKQWPAAKRHYRTAWQADRSYVGVALGLARTRIRLGDRQGAVTAADEVPDVSRHANTARVAAFRLLTGQAGTGQDATGQDAASAWPGEDDLANAAERLRKPPLAAGDLGAERHCRLLALLLEARLDQASKAARASALDGGKARDGAGVAKARAALEDCYRQLAKTATSQSQHTILIDLANHVRTRTLD
jgi:serine/threonine-protein kinase PknG